MMVRKSIALSPRVRRVKKSAKPTPDHKIDFSDLAEFSDEQLAAMKPVGRPMIGDKPRKLIAVRLDQEVLSKLRREAKKKRTGYQSLINEILAKHVKRKKDGREAA